MVASSSQLQASDFQALGIAANLIADQPALQQQLAACKILNLAVGENLRDYLNSGLYVVLTGKVRILDQQGDLVVSLLVGEVLGERLYNHSDYEIRAGLELRLVQLSPPQVAALTQHSPTFADRLQQGQQLSLTALGLTQQVPVPRAKSSRAHRVASVTPASPPPQGAKSRPSKVQFPTPKGRTGRLFRRLVHKYPFIQQQSAVDCGVTCLLMIGRFWGKRFDLNQLRNLANVDRRGASLKGLMIAAEAIGFAPRPVKASLDQLASQPLPAIAHWEGIHYIVVYEVTKREVLVADPEIGPRRLTHAAFLAGWSGYTLLLQPTSMLEQVPEAKRSLGRFFALLKPHWLVLTEIAVASLVMQVFGLVTPIMTQLLLDRVVVQRSTTTLMTVGVGLIIFSLFKIGISSLRRYLLRHTANRIDVALVVGFISHALQLNLSYFETRYVGDITSRIGENQKIRRFITGEALNTLLDMSTVFVYIILMFWYSWQMSLLALSLIPLLGGVALIATPFLRQLSRESFTARARESSYLIESLTGIGTVKAMGIERRIRWKWEQLLNRYIKIHFSGQILREQIRFTSRVIETTISRLLLLVGIWQVINDQLTIGQLMAFNMVMGNVIGPFMGLIDLWDDFQEVLISVERLNDVIDAPAEADRQDESKITLADIQGHIRFENVTFRYNLETTTNTLQNLSFEVLPGQTVALVGRSGSGKTTVSKLLLGLYLPTDGKIFIDGHDVTTIALHSLRQQVGVVDQNTFLFGGSIRENLMVGHPEATEADMLEAARLAGANQFIAAMPMQYDAQIGEGGGMLSGGQRQRLAIARALIGQPRLLVFDEATSSLDAETERLIQENLGEILHQQTSFIIAHRLSTIRNADLILVLDQGILVESGTHDELMHKRGRYYHLNHQQLLVAS
ncbi:peptidase domain-containing ABC transporter [filamentous cyanobacterium LEGE 11480]|uniref:Peptidase domain-containing ABC transporter n=1 Tax=Romeriopsis navalis LEGE 11480 TaxID=2777977 RepID=A0A928Z3U6_9CYAN|nr:peptidase domain-containing ABC transporter [Romeriopsis navalis]MBE9031054.1 peptidase domain-containing ABC transporter [Romeriopsis navalis LEGE 11480]